VQDDSLKGSSKELKPIIKEIKDLRKYPDVIAVGVWTNEVCLSHKADRSRLIKRIDILDQPVIPNTTASWLRRGG
jgi:hypothetical protein